MPKITDMLIGPHGALSQSSSGSVRKSVTNPSSLTVSSSSTEKSLLFSDPLPSSSSSSALQSSSSSFVSRTVLSTPVPPTNLRSTSLSVSKDPTSLVATEPLLLTPNDTYYHSLINRLNGLTITETVLDTLFTKNELYTIVTRYGFRNILKVHETTKDIFISTCMKLVRLGRIKIPSVPLSVKNNEFPVPFDTEPNRTGLNVSSLVAYQDPSLFLNNRIDDGTSEHVSPTTQLALEGLLQEVVMDTEEEENKNNNRIPQAYPDGTIPTTNTNTVVYRGTVKNNLHDTVAYGNTVATVPSILTPLSNSKHNASIVGSTLSSLAIALPSRKVPKDQLIKEFEQAPILDDDAYYIDSDEINVTLSSDNESDHGTARGTVNENRTMEQERTAENQSAVTTGVPTNSIDNLKAKLSLATTITLQANKVLAEAQRTGTSVGVRKLPREHRTTVKKTNQKIYDDRSTKDAVSDGRRNWSKPVHDISSSSSSRCTTVGVPPPVQRKRERSVGYTTIDVSTKVTKDNSFNEGDTGMVSSTLSGIDKEVQTEPVLILPVSYPEPIHRSGTNIRYGISSLPESVRTENKQVSVAYSTIDNGYEPDNEENILRVHRIGNLAAAEDTEENPNLKEEEDSCTGTARSVEGKEDTRTKERIVPRTDQGKNVGNGLLLPGYQSVILGTGYYWSTDDGEDDDGAKHNVSP